MSNILRNLRVDFGSLVDEPANKGARILLFKRDSDAALIDADDLVGKVGRKMSSARLTALKAAVDNLNRILSEVADPEAGDDEDEAKEQGMKKQDTPPTESAPEVTPEAAPVVEKAGDEIAKRLADLEAQNVELRKQADEARDLAKRERDERLTREWVGKAEKLDALPVAADVLGPVLKRAVEVMPVEDFTELDRVLTAANELIGKSKLCTEIGKAGADTAGNAWDKVEALAKAAVEATPTLTIEKARVQVLRAHPELKAEYYLGRGAR